MNRVKGSVSRPLALAIALALPGSALAVGLGEARVDSYLNQPLDVRMRLLDATADELDSLTVVPASPDEFERLGLLSGALALGLEISVDRSQSPPVVRVRSSRPVNDPVVQLLIDARWSGGRMLREYTLFLDPSTVPVAPPPAEPARRETPDDSVDSGERADAPNRSEDRPAATPRTRPEPTQTEPRARARISGRYGPVASGDTLWSIARSALPASDISMDQMMIAIVELNPNAFRDGNINLLLRGSELQLPSAEQARAVDAAMAAAAVAEQNRAFGAGVAAALPVVSDAARGGPAGAGEDESPRPGSSRRSDSGGDAADHRLELVPPDDQEGGSGLSDDAAEMASLRQQLARTEEELYAARQEADAFRERLDELETLIDQREGGVGLRDAELASLEQTLRDAREATREDADPALRARVSERLDQYIADFADPDGAGMDPEIGEAASGEIAPAPSDEVADAGADGADEAAPEQADPVAEPPAEPVTTEVGGERTWLGFKPWMVLTALGAVVIAVLALLGSALGRRRKKAGDTKRSQPSVPPKRAKSEADPVESARQAVAERPSDLAAHVALLHTLSARADEGEFSDALENMFEHVETGNEPEWREALELAERVVPGHALVKGSSDWVADDQVTEAEPQTELDREVEVDDLMSRLDADMDEPDDSDWLRGDDEDRPLEDESGPLLRGDDAPAEAPAVDENDDDELDFGAWLSKDTADSDSGSSSDSDSTFKLEDSEPEPEPEFESEPESEDASDEELMMEWPDAESESGDAFEFPSEETQDSSAEDAPEELGESRSDASAAEDGADEWIGMDDTTESEDAAAPEDGSIFSQGDDDVEVKLDLARAYVSWNSTDSARTLLEEILREGNEEQQAEARKLLDGLSDDND